MARRLAMSSQKGGVGKTTSVANLAAVWGSQRRKVLAVDFDPQFALTRAFGASPREVPGTVVELLATDAGLGDCVAHDVAPGVDLLASSRDLRKLELTLVGEINREEFLADALGSDTDTYDYVLIDSPPNLGLLTVNAMVAAREILVPVSMQDEGALQGAAEVRATVGQLARKLDMRIASYVRTMGDPRRRVYRWIDESLSDFEPVAETTIPLRAHFHEAAADRVPLTVSKPDSEGAFAYRCLADELAAVEAVA